jgi:hypothetical protein
MRELAARSAEARERTLSRCQLLEPHLEGGGAAYGRDGSEVCFRTSQRLIVHPRTDATNSGKRSTTSNVTSYRPELHKKTRTRQFVQSDGRKA